MTNDLPDAVHNGEVMLGNLALPCCVLNDKNSTHIFSERAIFAILGIKGRGSKGGHRIPSILGKSYIKPFIPADTWVDIETPVFYTDSRIKCIGYKSEILGGIIKGLLLAHKSGALKNEVEKRYAAQAEILRDALVNVAIDALIDEATGYQKTRDSEALQKILDKYLRQELAAWAKRFPDEFYKEIFRLKDWQWQGMHLKRPGVVGRYTNNVVYERLAPGLLEELQRRNPVTKTGNRKNKHHQWLTEEIGHPKLRDHLIGVVAIMRSSANWNKFMRSLTRAYPITNDQLDLLDD